MTLIENKKTLSKHFKRKATTIRALIIFISAIFMFSLGAITVWSCMAPALQNAEDARREERTEIHKALIYAAKTNRLYSIQGTTMQFQIVQRRPKGIKRASLRKGRMMAEMAGK